MNVLLLLLALVPLISGFSCDLELSEARLLSKNDGSSLYQLYVINPTPFLARSVMLVPTAPLISVQNMRMSPDGLSFPRDFEGIAPHKTYPFNFSCSGSVEIMIKWASCDEFKEDTEPLPVKAERNLAHEDNNHGNKHDDPTHKPHSTAPPTSAPTAAHPTSAPPTAAHPTSAPPTAAPTSAPHTAAPTSAPTSAPPASPTASGSINGVCSGTPRMLNGKPCASTTRYWDDQKGACGCGTTNAFSWIGTQYTAAASPPLFGTATWCGTGCGKCYNLTTTGFSPDGKGAAHGESIVIMVTNLCPPGGAWCAAGLNSFEYGAHFDLADAPTNGLITQLGWDNPEVVYEEVPCTGALNSPTTTEFNQCQCASQ